MLCTRLRNHKWTNLSPGNLYLHLICFIDMNIFSSDLSYTVSQYFMTLALMAVRQEVNNFESSIVVQELEFAMNLALYGLL